MVKAALPLLCDVHHKADGTFQATGLPWKSLLKWGGEGAGCRNLNYICYNSASYFSQLKTAQLKTGQHVNASCWLTGNEQKVMKTWKPLEIFPLNQPQLYIGKPYKRCLKKCKESVKIYHGSSTNSTYPSKSSGERYHLVATYSV